MACYCQSQGVSDFPVLKEILPKNYDYNVCEFLHLDENSYQASVRIDIKTKEGVKQWKTEFETLTKTTYRVLRSFPENSKKNLYKISYMCQHSSHQLKASNPKNSACKSKLHFILRKVVKYSRSSDIHMPSHPTILKLDWNHNHCIDSISSLMYRDVSKETEEKLCDLFEKGHNPSSALEMLKNNLQESMGESYVHAVGDRGTVPDLQFVYRLHYKHFRSARDVIAAGFEDTGESTNCMSEVKDPCNNSEGTCLSEENSSRKAEMSQESPQTTLKCLSGEDTSLTKELSQESQQLLSTQDAAEENSSIEDLLKLESSQTLLNQNSVRNSISGEICSSIGEMSQESLQLSSKQNSAEENYSLGLKKEMFKETSQKPLNQNAVRNCFNGENTAEENSTLKQLLSRVGPQLQTRLNQNSARGCLSGEGSSSKGKISQDSPNLLSKRKASQALAAQCSAMHAFVDKIFETMSSDPEYFLPAVRAFMNSANSIQTNSSLVSALNTFGKCSGLNTPSNIKLSCSSEEIGVQSPATACRKRKLPVNCGARAGQPSMTNSVGVTISNMKENESMKVLRTLLLKRKAADNLSSCVNLNDNLGKAHIS